MLISAFITEEINIAFIFGGFMMGLAMPRHARLTEEVTRRIEDFTVTLLLPIFFVYTGLKMNVRLLDRPERGGNPQAARAVGLTLVSVEANGLDGLEPAFATMVSERTQAFIVLGDSILYNYRGQLAATATRNRLPGASSLREYAEAGFLLTYGPDFRDIYRRAAIFIDKIFKGAKPADLPIEQPTKFELVVNLKTAKALGLPVPQTLLARADEVIE